MRNLLAQQFASWFTGGGWVEIEMEMPHWLRVDMLEQMRELLDGEFAAIEVDVEDFYWDGLAEKVIDDELWVHTIRER